MQPKKITFDFILSFSAVALMNFTLQILVYPRLQTQLGEMVFGQMIYMLGIIDIFAPAIGLASNNDRLLHQKTENSVNGDYLFAILILGGITGIGVWLFLGRPSIIPFFLLYFATILRTYLVVQFRLNLNYKHYFAFYVCVSIGYLIGANLLYSALGWMGVLLVGELLAVVYVLCTGTILRPPYRLTDAFGATMKGITVLSLSTLAANCAVYMDRILLGFFLSDETVTYYYVASLLGKTIVMVVNPLNVVLVSYLTRVKNKLNSKIYLQVCGACMGMAALAYGAVLLIYPFFVQLLYPDLYDNVIRLGILGNLAPILFFAGSLLITLLLVICTPIWQLIIQGCYLLLFAVLAIIGIANSGLYGFAIAAVIANAIRLAAIIFVGLIYIRKQHVNLLQ